MTIKISQLAPLGIIQANVILPVVSNITGTGTTYQASVQQLQTFIIANGVSNDIANLYANASTQSDLINGINANVTQANVAMTGYVNTLINSGNVAINAANVGMKGYVDQANSIQSSQITSLISNAATQSDLIIGINANVTAANVGMLGYVNSQISADTTAWTANAYQQQALIGNLQASAYSNVNTAAYLTAQNITSYSNVQVGAFFNALANVNSIVVGNITSGPTSLSPGASGNVLTSNGVNWVSNAVVKSVGYGATLSGNLGPGGSNVRSFGSTYTNSTGRPIFVYIGASNNNSYGTVAINGVIVMYMNGYGTTTGVSFIVPPGATYSVSYGNPVLTWFEY